MGWGRDAVVSVCTAIVVVLAVQVVEGPPTAGPTPWAAVTVPEQICPSERNGDKMSSPSDVYTDHNPPTPQGEVFGYPPSSLLPSDIPSRDDVYTDHNPPTPRSDAWRGRLANASARAVCSNYHWDPVKGGKQNRMYYGVQLNFELHLLRILLYEVYPFVDVIIIVENVRHHAFQSKALYYERSKETFALFHDKIRHVVVDDTAMAPSEGKVSKKKRAMEMDYHQRNSILRGLWDIRDEDVFVLADLDEVLSTETVRALRDCDVPPYLNMKMTWHNFNFACTYHHRKADGVSRKPFWNIGPHAVRGFVTKQIRPIRKIRWPPSASKSNAAFGKWKSVETSTADGWHMSYFMSVEQIRLKMISYSHPELGQYSANMEPRHVRQCMRECLKLDKRPNVANALAIAVKHEVPIPLSGLPWLVQLFPQYYSVLLR